MAEQVTVIIDGREISALVGSTILEAALDANIHIPHLCHNDEINPYGACRLCMVEITDGSRTRLVASCIYQVDDGLKLETVTARVLNVRKLVVELMMASNPHHRVIKKLAAELGIEQTRFESERRGCILCAQCVRTCREVVGVSAIGFKGRGCTREVAAPFDAPPPDCIACGSCAYICPVEIIPMKEENGIRTIWKTDFPMQKCSKCGRDIAPVKQLEYFRKIVNLADEHFDNCIHCR
ncbi:MAG: 2Fe-2S iron-sulfur cluster binding domain-containing protein [Proteobacteria bacterium]|nr:2Fe-2S iron-sulfur cluster binding domain-containing protein [Pseudomonadota bacterium]